MLDSPGENFVRILDVQGKRQYDEHFGLREQIYRKENVNTFLIHHYEGEEFALEGKITVEAICFVMELIFRSIHGN